MQQGQSVGSLMFEAWREMARTAIPFTFLFGFFSLPIVLIVVVTVPAMLGFAVIAFAAQVMMSSAYSLVLEDEQREQLEQAVGDISYRHLLLGALVVGGSAQVVMLGVPVLVGVYLNPTAAFFVAVLFPFVDGKLNQRHKLLAPSVWVRYGSFWMLRAVGSFRESDLDAIEAGLLTFRGPQPS